MTDLEKIEALGGYNVLAARPTDAEFEAGVRELEQSTGAPLPARYRAFLRDCGGLALPSESMPRAFQDGDFTLMAFFGVAPGDDYDLRANLDAVKSHIPAGAFPFATDPFGSLFLLLQSGEIGFWEHETGEMLMLSPSFDEMWKLFK